LRVKEKRSITASASYYHHRAYKIEMLVCSCEFEAMASRIQRYMFKMADCAAIVNELDEVDWFSLSSGKMMDCCLHPVLRDGMELL
jgi:hypothetical protein